MFIRNWQRSWLIITLFSLFALLNVNCSQAFEITLISPPQLTVVSATVNLMGRVPVGITLSSVQVAVSHNVSGPSNATFNMTVTALLL